MVMTSDALSARMTCWAVRGRRPHSLVSLSTLCCAATMGRRVSEFWSRISTFLRTPVIPGWSHGVAVMWWIGGRCGEWNNSRTIPACACPCAARGGRPLLWAPSL